MVSDDFYEKFWADGKYQERYAFDSAVRDRYPAIRKVWGEMPNPTTVLDYGCGNGVLTYWLKCNGFGVRILGVDVSNTGIEYARRHFPRPGLEFEPADTILNRNPGYFDVIVSSHVLEHMENPGAWLRGVSGMSDWLLLEVPLEKCLWQRLSHFFRSHPQEDNPLGHVNFWSKDSFNKFIEDSGFFVVRDYQYASAPYSPFNHVAKRHLERLMLATLGLELYGRIMATHYIVLARRATCP